ncbi:MAG: hypothetical protein ACYCYI_08595 [Saccharofermentanales bacterium]
MKQSKSVLFIILAVFMSLILAVGCTPKVSPVTSSDVASSEAVSGTSSEESSEAVSSEETSSEAVSGESSEAVSGASSTAASSAIVSGTSKAPTATPTKAVSAKTGVKVDPKTLTGRAKDLKGRTIKININTATDPESIGGKLRIRNDARLTKLLNCKIEYVLQHNETGGNYEIVNSVLAGKPKVDVWVQNGWLEVVPHYRAGVIQPLEALKVFDWSEWSSDVALSKFGGKTYCVAAKINPVTGVGNNMIWVTHSLFYNQKLLDDYGINDDINGLVKSGQWTWDKFADICKRFNQNATGVAGLKALWEWNEAYDMLLASYKSDWVLRNPTSGTYSFGAGTTNAQAALVKYKDLVTQGVISIENDSSGLNAAFAAGKAAFLFRFLAGMRWGFGDTGLAEVKANWGLATVPSLKSGVANIQCVSYAGAGGYSIPVGIAKANEVATVLNQWFNSDLDYEDEKEAFLQQFVYSQLNERNGDKTLEIIDIMYDICAREKDFRLSSSFTIHTNPGVGNWTVGNNDSWYTHSRKIAQGTEAMGTTITSMTPFYNKILGDFTKAR